MSGVLEHARSLLHKALSPKQRLALRNRLFPSDNANAHSHFGDRPTDDKPQSEYDRLFWEHDGNLTHKWHHYPDIYQTHLERFKNRAVRVLEIGVSTGGSLQIMRAFFGPQAIIFGVDIDAKCAAYDGQGGSVRIGSQSDPEFLRRVVAEMGGIDIVIDDGSHVSDHMRTSLLCLFPLLEESGIYIIEDMHCAYWNSYLGGYRSRRSMFASLSSIINDMHHWYHGRAVTFAPLKDLIGAVHVYDSMMVFDKKSVKRPLHSVRGKAHVVSGKP